MLIPCLTFHKNEQNIRRVQMPSLQREIRFHNIVTMIFQFNFGITIFSIFLETNFALNCLEKAVRFCQCKEDGRTYVVNCSHNGLKSIPKNIPIRTTHLYLDNNNIKILENESFKQGNRGFSHLVTLSIKRNKLEKIESAAFRGLPNLKELNLYNNSLEKETSLPKLVFKSVNKSLKMLDIRLNLMNPNIELVNYPKSVSELHNLVELRIDCLTNKSLPVEYSSLKHLQTLIFGGGRWNVKMLHQNMFVAISKLRVTKIDLTGLYISMIFEKTFSSLKSLNWLDLSNNPRLNLSMKNFSASLNETSITKLSLNNTGIGTASQNASTLLRYFCNLPLKELTLDHNRINRMDPVFKECFLDMEVLSFGDNYLLITSEFVYDTIYGLPNLIGFNLTWQRQSNSMAKTSYGKLKTVFKNKSNGKRGICEKGMSCPLILPPKLQWVDISHHGFYFVVIPQSVILTNSSLKSIGASNCGIQTMKLPVYCPPDRNIKIHIERLDVSNNGLQCVNATSFDQKVTKCDWKSVKYVNFRNNQLGNIETNTCNRDRNNIVGFLRPLTGLKTLDLAMNMFESTDRLHDLEYLTNLEVLDLSHNGFQNFTLRWSSFTSLMKLNLSYNNLRCLSQKTMSELRTLQKLHPSHIEIDLTGNPLSCNCECYTFFQWMSTTEIILTNNNTYQCVFDNGKKAILSPIESIISQLFSQCFSPTWLGIYIGTEASVLVLITVFCLVYRMRHEMWYMYLRIKLNRQKLTALLNQKNYKYTAFVSCDHRDAKYFIIKRFLPNLETPQTNFKFCIAQRDFVVGATIIGNIMAAMHNSQKIIFIISQYFLTSKWCKEELIIAHQVNYIYI